MYYSAWVDAGEEFSAAHEREDLDVFAFRLLEQEGAFCSLVLEVRNPAIGLLNAGRKQWLWFAYDDGSSAGAVPLFYGRLIGVPQDLQAEFVSLEFIGRPTDFVEQKAAIFAAYDPPEFDPVWIAESARSDPDSLLEFLPAAWHVDRTSHVVTLSDLIAGEAGTVAIGGEYFYESLSIKYRDPPARRARVVAKVEWSQESAGELDLSSAIVAAFAAAGGSRSGVITSLTGQGLAADWPEKGDRIGGQWSVGTSSVRILNGTIGPTLLTEIPLGFRGAIAKIPAIDLKPTFFVAWDVSRPRRETATFEIEADVQSLLADPGEAETIEIELGSRAVEEPIDAPSSAEPGGTLPIGDKARPRYFQTARGLQSIEAAIRIARARLIWRARAVDIQIETPIATGIALSCRHSISIADDRLPGGAATGKVVELELISSGGVESARIKIACTIGKGATATGAAGTPDYVEDGYAEAGWQTRTGASVEAVAGEITYEDFSGQPIDDDGIDFLNMTREANLKSITVINGPATQRALLTAGSYFDVQEAANAVNSIPTEIEVELWPISRGPFESEFAITVSDLAVPKTIDLEAA